MSIANASHGAMGTRFAPESPDPSRPVPTLNYYRPKAASMTSGRGWPSTRRDHPPAISASVMDGHFVASDRGVR